MSTIIATTVKATTIQTSAGKEVTLTRQDASKGWCNFQQSSSHTIRDSVNISSLNDDGAGLTDTNYTNNFANDDYVAGGHGGRQSSTSVTAYWLFPTADGGTIVYSTSSTSWTGGYSNGSSSDLGPFDMDLALCTIHGELA